MKRLFVRLGLFFAPLAAIYLGLFAFAFYMGEAMPLTSVMQMQMGDTPLLYGVVDSNIQYAYKLMNLRARQPRVLVFGSSRSMEMRSAFFSVPPSDFYNASVNSAELDTFSDFLAAIDPSQPPQLLLWQLDQPLLIEPPIDAPLPPESVYLNDSLSNSIGGFERMMQNLFSQRVSPTALLARRDPLNNHLALGIEAIRVARGVRNDGSTQNGSIILNPNAVRDGVNQHRRELEARTGRYTPATELQLDNIARVEAILAEASELSIQVVGYSAPFHPDIYATMRESGDYAYLDAVAPAMHELFAQYGFPYFDFSDPATLDLTVADFWDGWHSSELASLRMVIRMAEEEPAIFSEFVALPVLQEVANEAENTFRVFN